MAYKTYVLNENMNDEDFIQIMPVPANLYSRYHDEEGYFYCPIVCMALRNDGSVVFCDTDSFGEINACGIDYKNPICKYNPETKEYKEL